MNRVLQDLFLGISVYLWIGLIIVVLSLVQRQLTKAPYEPLISQEFLDEAPVSSRVEYFILLFTVGSIAWPAVVYLICKEISEDGR